MDACFGRRRVARPRRTVRGVTRTEVGVRGMGARGVTARFRARFTTPPSLMFCTTRVVAPRRGMSHTTNHIGAVAASSPSSIVCASIALGGTTWWQIPGGEPGGACRRVSAYARAPRPGVRNTRLRGLCGVRMSPVCPMAMCPMPPPRIGAGRRDAMVARDGAEQVEGPPACIGPTAAGTAGFLGKVRGPTFTLRRRTSSFLHSPTPTRTVDWTCTSPISPRTLGTPHPALAVFSSWLVTWIPPGKGSTVGWIRGVSGDRILAIVCGLGLCGVGLPDLPAPYIGVLAEGPTDVAVLIGLVDVRGAVGIVGRLLDVLPLSRRRWWPRRS